jgi:5-dehydro-2-deoxygluconokinase
LPAPDELKGADLTERELDLVAMGRAIVDVYGDQAGCRLEEVASFSRYVGGCPANIAIGTARLGLRVGFITRVGDEQHGRFLRERMEAEGVDVSCVRTDPHRLTGVAFLGIRDRDTFPLLHYRRDCADMAITPDDYTQADIARAGALLVSGSHLSSADAAANIDAAINRAESAGTRVIFDIDYRPLFWGLTHQDQGESRFAESNDVTLASQRILSFCDLIVGTEEEIHITGGSQDTLTALRAIRRLTDAAIVLKRGPRGCVVFPDAVPASLEGGIVCPGFAVEVFNAVGAGDGFMSGFLYGWLRDEPWQTCGRSGNACGALVVSRHGCSPASPTRAELEWFLENDAVRSDLYRDPELAFIHRATTRRRRPASLRIVGCDIDPPLAPDHWAPGRTPSRFQVVAAMALAAAGHPADFGVMVDARHGQDALHALGSTLEWIARRIDVGSAPPLELDEGQPAGITLKYWPRHLVAACRVPRASGTAAAVQSERLRELFLACQHHGHELLLEPAGLDTAAPGDDLKARVRLLLEAGVRPDWWLVPCLSDAEALDALAVAIADRDRYCRGIIVVDPARAGIGGMAAFAWPQHPLFKGFVLRERVAALARNWLGGKVDDATLQGALRESLSSAAENPALVE